MSQSPNVKSKRDDSGIDAKTNGAGALAADLVGEARGILVGTAGDLDVTTIAGNRVIIPNAPAGLLPLCVTTVHSAGSTAQDVTLII